MHKLLIALSVALLSLVVCEVSVALPRYALLAGAKCGSCHVNPTGGQMRNDYGIQYSLEQMPLAAHKEDDFTLDPKLSESFSIGGDYRGQFLYDFTEDPSDKTKGKNTFHAMTANIYSSVKIGSKQTFYLRYDLLNPTYKERSGPEVYLIAKVLPGNWYIKGGVMLPDFGWRVDDHTAYTRGGDLGYIPGGPFNNGMIFLPNYKDIGVEVGGYLDKLFVTAGLFNGSGNQSRIDFTTDKAYSMKLDYMGSVSDLNFRLGISGYGFRSYKLGGVHAGVAFGDFVWTGEMDWTHERWDGNTLFIGQNTMAASSEIDYRLMQGLWGTAKYDLFDPMQGETDDDATSATNSLKRVTLGLEFFPYSFIEVRPQYRLNLETPGVENDNALIQMHVWF